MSEDKTTGGVTWHSSEDSGGPDVGISVYVGKGDRLWCGEISRDLWDRCQGFQHFDTDHGWFLVRFRSDGPTCLIAKFGDQDEALEFMEQVAWWIRESEAPTIARNPR